MKADARFLRLACRALRDAVADHRWGDHETAITNVGRWHASFPRARGANLRNLKRQEIFALAGVETLLICGTVPANFFDVTFESLINLYLM